MARTYTTPVPENYKNSPEGRNEARLDEMVTRLVTASEANSVKLDAILAKVNNMYDAFFTSEKQVTIKVQVV